MKIPTPPTLRLTGPMSRPRARPCGRDGRIRSALHPQAEEGSNSLTLRPGAPAFKRRAWGSVRSDKLRALATRKSGSLLSCFNNLSWIWPSSPARRDLSGRPWPGCCSFIHAGWKLRISGQQRGTSDGQDQLVKSGQRHRARDDVPSKNARIDTVDIPRRQIQRPRHAARAHRRSNGARAVFRQIRNGSVRLQSGAAELMDALLRPTRAGVRRPVRPICRHRLPQ